MKGFIIQKGYMTGFMRLKNPFEGLLFYTHFLQCRYKPKTFLYQNDQLIELYKPLKFEQILRRSFTKWYVSHGFTLCMSLLTWCERCIQSTGEIQIKIGKKDFVFILSQPSLVEKKWFLEHKQINTCPIQWRKNLRKIIYQKKVLIKMVKRKLKWSELSRME